jgi:hypothetical protein
MATTEQFVDHAPVEDGASNLFVQIFGSEPGHVRLVYGVQSLPVAAPLIVDAIFEIEPASSMRWIRTEASRRGSSRNSSRTKSERR